MYDSTKDLKIRVAAVGGGEARDFSGCTYFSDTHAFIESLRGNHCRTACNVIIITSQSMKIHDGFSRKKKKIEKNPRKFGLRPSDSSPNDIFYCT